MAGGGRRAGEGRAARPISGAFQSAELIEDFLLGWKTSLVVLRENFLVIDSDIEDPAAAAHELAFHSERFLDFGRQTGGPRKVISDAAVIDFDFHSSL
jgi:hypothetical protein